MSRMTRDEGHLVVAGIRVLVHSLGRGPTPDELAELLGLASGSVRLQLVALAELGAVAMVESAFETHAEVRDYGRLEELSEEGGPAITDDLKAFDEKKRQETERMSQLFESGEQEDRLKEKHRQMDQELESFRKQKPENPFGD
ncbi:MAG: hypothetical protein GY838_06395 [bacterium]|nr:hypothetical protein [bacterium]